MAPPPPQPACAITSLDDLYRSYALRLQTIKNYLQTKYHMKGSADKSSSIQRLQDAAELQLKQEKSNIIEPLMSVKCFDKEAEHIPDIVINSFHDMLKEINKDRKSDKDYVEHYIPDFQSIEMPAQAIELTHVVIKALRKNKGQFECAESLCMHIVATFSPVFKKVFENFEEQIERAQKTVTEHFRQIEMRLDDKLKNDWAREKDNIRDNLGFGQYQQLFNCEDYQFRELDEDLRQEFITQIPIQLPATKGTYEATGYELLNNLRMYNFLFVEKL